MLVLLWLWPAHNLLLAGFSWWIPRPPHRSATGRTPLSFWIMIPALNEERVVRNTVLAALALATPETPVRVLVIDDNSDDRTFEVAASIGDPRVHILCREPPEARIGKGEALNAGFRYLKQKVAAEGGFERTVIGVIDGDGRGVPGMLHEVARFFADEKVGAVQCRVRIHNRGALLGFLQDIEFACIADAAQSMRDVLGCVDLGGNGQFIRLRTLAQAGEAPWSGCLVEDLELGLRLHLMGTKIRYASGASITQQGLVDKKRLIRQRARWAQGNLQCLNYLPRLFACPKVPPATLLDSAYYLLAPWLIVPLSVAVIALIFLFGYGQMTGDSVAGIVAAGGNTTPAVIVWLSAALTPGILWGIVHRVRLGDEPLHRAVAVGLIYPVFLGLGIVATWRALGRHLLKRNSWVKTERLVEEPQNVAVAS
jgi:cellulose synthase/poly-beta-1,6-N-acetylglucosamine synthase-like glycosyltransferase